MIEMVVAMVVILAVTAGLLQIARLAMAHTEAMHEARQRAGERAMQALPVWSPAAFIRDWTPGPDASAYSRDDVRVTAAATEFTSVIPAVARPQLLNSFRRGNPVSAIAAQSSPQIEFHLVRGEAVRNVSAPPAIRNLIYNSETIDVRGEAWLIYTRGIY